MPKKKPQLNYKRVPVEKPKSAPPQTIITRFNLATGTFETYDMGPIAGGSGGGPD